MRNYWFMMIEKFIWTLFLPSLPCLLLRGADWLNLRIGSAENIFFPDYWCWLFLTPRGSIIISRHLVPTRKQTRATKYIFYEEEAHACYFLGVPRDILTKNKTWGKQSGWFWQATEVVASLWRANDLRGEPRPSRLRAWCRVFVKKSSGP